MLLFVAIYTDFSLRSGEIKYVINAQEFINLLFAEVSSIEDPLLIKILAIIRKITQPNSGTIGQEVSKNFLEKIEIVL